VIYCSLVKNYKHGDDANLNVFDKCVVGHVYCK
jgi:hypothetical protein